MSNFIFNNHLKIDEIDSYNEFFGLVEASQLEVVKPMIVIEKANIRMRDMKISGLVFGSLMSIIEFSSLQIQSLILDGITMSSTRLIYLRSSKSSVMSANNLIFFNVENF